MTTQIEVLATIKDAIKDLNSAAIYITHDLAVVAQLADRIMVLRQGHLVEEGSLRKILAHPEHAYTHALLSARKSGETRSPRQSEGPPVLEVEGVTAAYPGGSSVLENVGLKMAKGRTVAVVGESGSGKSTLARVIAGLLPPVSGRILFRGEALPARYNDRSKEMLRRLQMIYQMPDVALNPRQRVFEILSRPMEFYFGLKGDENRRRVRRLAGTDRASDALHQPLPVRAFRGRKATHLHRARSGG